MTYRIRQVSSSDRNDVLDICKNNWDGHDYLPSVIDKWLTDPKRHVCGVETDGKLVAIACISLIEAGKTGWMEGLRVHVDYRKRGYAEALTEHVIEKGRELHAQRLRYATSTENAISLRMGDKNGFRKIVEMAVLWLENTKKAQTDGTRFQISPSEPKEIHELLRKNPHLIPEGILVYDWRALDYNSANLKSLEAFRFFKELKNGEIHSLSFGYQRADSSRWKLTIYATDQISFSSQLHHNVNVALENGFQSVTCTYQVEHEKDLQPTNLSENHWQTHLALLEKKLQ